MAFQDKFILFPLFLAGGIYGGFSFPSLPLIFPFASLIGGILLFAWVHGQGKSVLWGVGSWGLICLSLGFLSAFYRWSSSAPLPFEPPLEPMACYGEVKQVFYKPRGVQVVLGALEGCSVRDRELLQSSQMDHVLIFIPTSSFIPSLLSGVRLRLPPLFFKKAETTSLRSFFQGINAQGKRPVSWSSLHLVKESSLPTRHREVWRWQLSSFLRTHLTGHAGGLAAALVTGDRSGLPFSLVRDFSTAGLSHLLAISGLHLSLIAGIFFVWGRRLLARSSFLALYFPLKEIAAGGALTLSFLYVWISGGQVPAQRAFILVFFGFLGIFFKRQTHPLYSLGLAAFFLLFKEPENLWEPDFQLSFVSVLGLLKSLERSSFEGTEEEEEDFSWARRLCQKLWEFFKSSGRLTFMTFPFILKFFGTFPLYGMVANLIAIPFMGMVIMPSLLLLVITWPMGRFFPAFSGWEAFVEGALTLLEVWVQKISLWPGASLHVPMPPEATLWLWTSCALGGSLKETLDLKISSFVGKLLLWGGIIGGAGIWSLGGGGKPLLEEVNLATGERIQAFRGKDGALMVSSLGALGGASSEERRVLHKLMQRTGATRVKVKGPR